MKNRQKLKLGDAYVTPRNIQEVQASKLGDAQAFPSSSTKVSGHLSMRYIFIASYTMCYSWSVFIFVCCFLQFSFCFVCCNKWLDPIICCFGEDTLRFSCLEHSSFHFYRSTSVLVCLYFVQLLFFMIIYVQRFAQLSYLVRIDL